VIQVRALRQLVSPPISRFVATFDRNARRVHERAAQQDIPSMIQKRASPTAAMPRFWDLAADKQKPAKSE
jgi:hypothetical protein